MAVVTPFRGWRYSSKAASSLSQVVAPPYDVIGPALQDELYKASPYNVVQLELGKPQPSDNEQNSAYTRAAKFLKDWQAQGILEREPKPAYYLVEEAFEVEGKRLRRLVLFGAVQAEPFEKGIILPHEETTSGPKADRMKLIEATHTNISPVMMLYEDPSGSVRDMLDHQMKNVKPATGTFKTGGVSYRLWVIEDTAVQAQLQVTFSKRQLFIADGHHRYETALGFKSAGGKNDKGSGSVMTGLVDMKDPGLHVQSFHRVLSGLSPVQIEALHQKLNAAFEIRSSTTWPDADKAGHALADAMEAQGEGVCVLGLLEDKGKKATLYRLKPDFQIPQAPIPEFRECEPWVLHHVVIDPAFGASALQHLAFPHGVHEVASPLEKGEANLAFLVRAIPMGLFRRLIAKGQRLPPKATYFYPKLSTGVVMRTLDEDDTSRSFRN